MWRSLFLTLMILAGLTAEVRAEGRGPIVVELYTSQGCSSCPPADKFLHELAGRSDVLALGLHVDYWDYIGWKDVFGQKAHADRQRAYAHVGGRRSVYTPQMIIQGQEHVVGNHPKDVNALVKRHKAKAASVGLSVRRTAGKIEINAEPQAAPREATVLLVRYKPQAETKISRGENAGKSIRYANIVHELKVIGKWDMRAPLSLTARTGGDMKSAVIVQERGHGAILAAARVE